LDDRDEQYVYHTDPNRADTDNDGLNDGDEVEFWGENWSLDYDSDTFPNILDSDSDGDGYIDSEEIRKGSNPSDPQSKPEVTKIWLEAEDGNLSPPIVEDMDNAASSGGYIWVPQGSGNAWDSAYDSGYAEYAFEVPASGNYLIWGRVNANNGENDSFFVSIDGKDYFLWDTQVSNTWVWDQLNNRGGDDPIVYYLEAGWHTLLVKQREDGTKIDKILITDDPEFTPEGLGDGIIPQSIKIWLETEDSYLHSPMVMGSEEGASFNSYIWVPEGSGDARKSTYNSGYAEYDFEIPVSGDYLIWGRVNAINSRNNSFFVSIDGDGYALWDIQTSNDWIWDQVNSRRKDDPVVYYLEAGRHTLQIKQREDGTKLDRILITDDFDYVPD
jgi:hypothetical protein